MSGHGPDPAVCQQAAAHCNSASTHCALQRWFRAVTALPLHVAATHTSLDHAGLDRLNPLRALHAYVLTQSFGYPR